MPVQSGRHIISPSGGVGRRGIAAGDDVAGEGGGGGLK
jgi:hypothetical protein